MSIKVYKNKMDMGYGYDRYLLKVCYLIVFIIFNKWK